MNRDRHNVSTVKYRRYANVLNGAALHKTVDPKIGATSAGVILQEINPILERNNTSGEIGSRRGGRILLAPIVTVGLIIKMLEEERVGCGPVEQIPESVGG